jgi:hypothetical protein
MKFSPRLALGIVVAALVPAFALAPAAHAASQPREFCSTAATVGSQIDGSGCGSLASGTYWFGILYVQQTRQAYTCSILTVDGTNAVCNF